MKKIVAAGLSAALIALPVSGAFAGEIKPLTATKSTQSIPRGADSLMMGGVGPAGMLVGVITLLTVVAIVTDNNKSTGTTN